VTNAFRIIHVMIVSTALIIVTGCAKKDPWFSSSYPDFKAGPAGGADLIEIKDGVDHAKYKFILMDPVSFHYESSSQYRAIPPEVRKDLRNAFNSAFSEALGDAYPMVDKPRPDALRVRVAITGMVPSMPAADSTHTPVSVGGAAMKAELLDSWTNERVGAVIDRKEGIKQKAVKNTDPWDHTRKVFKFWAQRLRTWLDVTHNKK
jgi:hypothetical protein